MKGIVLHGGLGTRLRPLTYSGPKQLIQVANKPISQYVIEDLIESGIRDIAIVLGNTFPEIVMDYYGDGSRFGARFEYIFQEKPLGIAHAVSLCEEFVGNDKFVVYLGDNILQYGIKKYVSKFIERDLDSMILLKEVEDPRSFGVAKFSVDGKLVGLVEKPKDPPSKYAVIGVYMFKPIVFQAIKKLKPSWRGEYEITDTIQMLIDWGLKVGYEIIEGWWFDTGKKDDILTVNSIILDERIKDKKILGNIEESRIEGRVEIGENARIVSSHIRGPAIIGRDAEIINSYVGPYTSIGRGVKIIDSGVEYSIIMDESHIEGINIINESLIGRKTIIRKSKSGLPFVKLSLSDHSYIEL